MAIADEQLVAATDVAAEAERRTDLARAMSHLRPREREMLWLAYAQGSTHRDIAGIIGVKATSVRLLLFRARRKLAGLLKPTAIAHLQERQNVMMCECDREEDVPMRSRQPVAIALGRRAPDARQKLPRVRRSGRHRRSIRERS